MLKRLYLALFAAAFATPCMAMRIGYQMNCSLGKGTTQSQQFGGSTVILNPDD